MTSQIHSHFFRMTTLFAGWKKIKKSSTNFPHLCKNLFIPLWEWGRGRWESLPAKRIIKALNKWAQKYMVFFLIYLRWEKTHHAHPWYLVWDHYYPFNWIGIDSISVSCRQDFVLIYVCTLQFSVWHMRIQVKSLLPCGSHCVWKTSLPREDHH